MAAGLGVRHAFAGPLEATAGLRTCRGLEICAHHRGLVLVWDLEEDDVFDSTAEAQSRAPVCAHVAHPARVAAQRHEVAVPVHVQDLDGRPAPLAGPPAADLELLQPVDVAAASQAEADRAVDQVPFDPGRHQIARVGAYSGARPRLPAGSTIASARRQ